MKTASHEFPRQGQLPNRGTGSGEFSRVEWLIVSLSIMLFVDTAPYWRYKPSSPFMLERQDTSDKNSDLLRIASAYLETS